MSLCLSPLAVCTLDYPSHKGKEIRPSHSSLWPSKVDLFFTLLLKQIIEKCLGTDIGVWATAMLLNIKKKNLQVNLELGLFCLAISWFHNWTFILDLWTSRDEGGGGLQQNYHVNISITMTTKQNTSAGEGCVICLKAPRFSYYGTLSWDFVKLLFPRWRLTLCSNIKVVFHIWSLSFFLYRVKEASNCICCCVMIRFATLSKLHLHRYDSMCDLVQKVSGCLMLSCETQVWTWRKQSLPCSLKTSSSGRKMIIWKQCWV